MDEMVGDIGGPASFASAFPPAKGGLNDKISDKKMSEEESESVLMQRMHERHAEVLSGKKQRVEFFDSREDKQTSVDLYIEDIQRVQRYVDELRAGGLLQPIPVTSEITLADLANIGILLGWEAGLFLKDHQLFLATSKKLKEIDAPVGGYRFVAHSHPTLSDEAGQITGDKEAAKSQLEIAVTAKYTVMIYSKGKCYNVIDSSHNVYPTLNSRLDSTKTRMDNHRIYCRQPLQINALEKLGTDGNNLEKLLPESSAGSPDCSEFLDFFFGEDFLKTDDLDAQESSKNNAAGPPIEEEKKEELKLSGAKSTSFSLSQRRSRGLFGGYVSGSIPGSQTSPSPSNKEVEATHAVQDFFANCTELEANAFMEKISSLKSNVFAPFKNKSSSLDKK